MSSKKFINISPIIILQTLLILIIFIFFFFIKDILILAFLSYLTAISLEPAIIYLKKYFRTKFVPTGIVYLFFFLILIFIFVLILPNLINEINYLFIRINQILIINQIQISDFNINDLEPSLQDIKKIASEIGNFVSIISKSFSNMFQMFALIIMAFYFSLFKDYFYKKIVLLSQKYLNGEKIFHFLNSLENQLGAFVKVKIIAMSFIGFSTFLSLKLINVPFALTLAIIAFILEILPNLGPTIAIIPTFFISWFFLDIYAAFITLAFGLVLQKIENTLITPKLTNKNSNVDSLLTIFLIFVGLSLKGFLGAVLSIPIYIILRTIYSVYLKNHWQTILEDKAPPKINTTTPVKKAS